MTLDIEDIKRSIMEETKSLSNKPIDRSLRKHKPVYLVENHVSKYSTRNALLHLKAWIGQVRQVYHWPIIGYWAKTLANLARLTRRLSQLNDDADIVRNRLNKVEAELAKSKLVASHHLERVELLETQLAHTTATLESTRAHFTKQINGINLSKKEILCDVSDLGIRLDDVAQNQGKAPASSMDLDRFYYDFENQFRSDPGVLHEKLQKYLEFLPQQIEFNKKPFLDIGFGRGEWLRTLKDNGIAALGVDSNKIMVDLAKEASLDVNQGDALEYLKSQDTNSFGGVSGFHVVEHIPFKQLIFLFDQIYRVLAPGGVLIFETPNPENLRVGSCNFYTDPTHLNPIPPHTLSFIAKNRGFQNVDLIRSTPTIQSERADLRDAEALSDWVNKEQDYAIIGFKPEHIAAPVTTGQADRPTPII